MTDRINELASLLSFSEKALNDRRRMIRMANPKDVEGQLLAWLTSAWEETRDMVKVPARQSGYVEVVFGTSVPYQEMMLPGDDGDEVESVRDDIQTQFSVDARTRRALEGERSQEAQKAQLRSFTEEMRRKIRKGEDITPHLAQLQRELRSERAA